MKHERYLTEAITGFLKKKMVMIGGPRQVGKTTLALSLLRRHGDERDPAYLNWDAPGVAKRLIQGELPADQPIVILDEIHKYRFWRNLIKGLYDSNRSRIHFLVTGSAKLDHFSKGGDSLLGRYYYLRLHPFSLNELSKNAGNEELESLLKFGGFPEPLFSKSERELKLWQTARLRQIVRDDLRDLAQVKEISQLELLAETLVDRASNVLSINNLREDLQLDFKTVSRWIGILESLFYCYRIAPFGADKIRAVKKEQKLYLWDWSSVPNEGARFENLVASQLLKYCHFLEDTEGEKMELRFLRDATGREVDFVVLKNKKPLFAVEAKLSDSSISRSLQYFSDRVKIPVFYQVHTQKDHFVRGNIEVIPFIQFCKKLKMP